MKIRIISILLIIAIICSFTVSVYAQEEPKPQGESYYEVDVSFAVPTYGIKGIPMTFMIPEDESGVYIKAESITELLSLYDYFFSFEMTHTQCCIASKDIDFCVIYRFNSPDVFVYVAGSMIEYSTPLHSIYSSGTAWLPFDFTMDLFNCAYTESPKGIEIQSPSFSTLMTIAMLSGSNNYAFDMVGEVYNSHFSHLASKASALTVTTLNSMLTDNATYAWSDIISLGGHHATEDHYSRSVSSLFVTTSEDEVTAINGDTNDAFIQTMKNHSSLLDTAVSALSADCSTHTLIDIVNSVTNMSSSLKKSPKVSAIVPLLQKNKDEIDEWCEIIAPRMKDFGKYTTGITWLLRLYEFLFFWFSFAEKNDVAAEALIAYSSETDSPSGGAMKDYAETDLTDIKEVISIFLAEKGLDTFIAMIPSSAVTTIVGAPAAFLTFCWSCAANLIPPIKNSIEGMDSFMISDCAADHQNYAKKLLNKHKNSTFVGNNVNRDSLEKLKQHTYSHLKFALISRNAALTSVNKSGKVLQSTKDKLKKEFEAKNRDIGIMLKSLEIEGNEYLPQDVSQNLSDWKNVPLMDSIRQNGTKLDRVSQKHVPLSELASLPGDFKISPDDAILIAKKILGRSFHKLIFDNLLKDLCTFEVSNDVCYIEEEYTYAYVVRYLVAGQADDICIMVSLDGNSAWIAFAQPNGYFTYYTGFNFLDYKTSDLVQIIKDAQNGIVKMGTTEYMKQNE